MQQLKNYEETLQRWVEAEFEHQQIKPVPENADQEQELFEEICDLERYLMGTFGVPEAELSNMLMTLRRGYYRRLAGEE